MKKEQGLSGLEIKLSIVFERHIVTDLSAFYHNTHFKPLSKTEQGMIIMKIVTLLDLQIGFGTQFFCNPVAVFRAGT